MFIEFSVKNYRSIRDLQTLSFVKTGLKSSEEFLEVDSNNIFCDGGINLLKTVGIYGANGSGKSNIIRALSYFLEAIKNEPSSESQLKAVCEPFLFQENANTQESFFQIVFIFNEKKYRYGFTCKINPDVSSTEKISKEIIVNEWLYGTKDKNFGEYFTRNGMTVKKDLLSDNEKIPSLQYAHTLFLTHASAFDSGGICALIRNYFRGWTLSNVVNGLNGFRWNSVFLIEQEKRKEEFLKLLSSFNLKYDDIFIEREPNKTDLTDIKKDKIFLVKSFINKQSEIAKINLNLEYNESAGTQKLFDLAGLLLRAFTLNVGGLIILDEVDSDFHPSLLIKLIGLFNTPSLNKCNCQLLFTSHDTNLMSPGIMRRDQFYFTEKNEDDSSRLYSLADLKGIRNDADFSRQYLAGYYGAVPILDEYSHPNVRQNDGTMES